VGPTLKPFFQKVSERIAVSRPGSGVPALSGGGSSLLSMQINMITFVMHQEKKERTELRDQLSGQLGQILRKIQALAGIWTWDQMLGLNLTL
jgi:hypothetical protein